METVKAIILLGLDGKRVLARYFDDRIKSKQFDRQVYSKTKAKKLREQIFTAEGYVVVHRCVNDLHLYVAGSRSENPLVLDQILNCLTEAVAEIRTSCTDQDWIQETMDQLIIALDEICDSGILLETDPRLVIDRVTFKPDLSTTRFSFPWGN